MLILSYAKRLFSSFFKKIKQITAAEKRSVIIFKILQIK